MLDRMKQMMEFKKQADRIKKELDNTHIEVTDVHGIRIVVNGAQHFEAIDIDETMLSAESKKKLEGDMLRAVNSAISRSQAAGAQKMKDIVGVNMPGF